VFSEHNRALLQAIPAFAQICIGLVWIPVGVSFGIVFEFVLRTNDNITYEGLLTINPGRWKPWKRTFSTLITAYVFAFIIGINAFQIGIGGVLLNNFIVSGPSGQPWLSLAVGFVTGFTFPLVRDIVTQFKPERRDASSPRANTGANASQGEGVGQR
jgi:hypothetical protein